MITPDAPASIHHLFPLMAPLAFSSLNDVALVALSITGSTLAAKRSAFVLVEDDAVTLRLPELWGAPWLRARKLALPHPVAIDLASDHAGSFYVDSSERTSSPVS